ncbi:MAG: GspH/FimT family pseudopilin [Pseudomonadota bacterium]
MGRKKDQRGFTLIEAMVVVVIMSIMAGIGIPAFMSYRPRIQLAGAARQVMTQLLLARMEAVKNVCNVKYTFGSGTAAVKWVDANRNGLQETDELTNSDLGNTYDIVTKLYAAPIQFNSRGAAPVNGQIALESSAGQRIITVNIAGHVRVGDLIVPSP